MIAAPHPVPYSKTAASLLLLTLLAACGGGGGSGSAAATAVPYSAVVFTDPKSSVALVETNADGTGIVAYRDAAGQISRVEFLAKDKTVYTMGVVNGRVENVSFDGTTLKLTGFDAADQATGYVLTDAEGAVVTASLPKAGQDAAKVFEGNTVARCVANNSGSADEPLDGQVTSTVCTATVSTGLFGHPIFTAGNAVLEYGVGLTQRQIDRLRDLTGRVTTFVNTELPASAARLRSLLRGDVGASPQVIPGSTPGTQTPGLISDVDRLKAPGTGTALTIDAGQLAPTAKPAPAPAPTPAPAPSPTPAPAPAPTPVPAPTPPTTAPSPTPSPVSPFAGVYSVSGGGVTLGFTVDAAGKISVCTSGALVKCSGEVGSDGSFNISGNDGQSPVDISATLKGAIGATGQVTGSFSSSSSSEGAASGSFVGSRTSAPPPAAGSTSTCKAVTNSYSYTKYCYYVDRVTGKEIKHGLSEEFLLENDQLMASLTYADGVLAGPAKHYDSDPITGGGGRNNYRLGAEGSYAKGKQTGTWKYYHTSSYNVDVVSLGKLSAEVTYGLLFNGDTVAAVDKRYCSWSTSVHASKRGQLAGITSINLATGTYLPDQQFFKSGCSSQPD